MLFVQSAQPNHFLRPFVRAYAQRNVSISDTPTIQAVPARLETVLDFEFGELFHIDLLDGPGFTAHRVSIIGPQTHCRGKVRMFGNIQSFAVFFQPAGFMRLFGVPVWELRNSARDAAAEQIPDMRGLWNELADISDFAQRVSRIEAYLGSLAQKKTSEFELAAFAMDHMLQQGGAIHLPDLVQNLGLSRRHFERLFINQVGLPPKTYMRIARFQTALDAKVAHPSRTWIDIAHSLNYYDQMHMVHDFKLLAGASPTKVFKELGDMRPDALAEASLAGCQGIRGFSETVPGHLATLRQTEGVVSKPLSERY